jgi:peptidoglycan/LPS O-acetylase OafA/YrhL
MSEPPVGMTSTRSPRPHLNALTGLRFFAAAYVVTYHYGARALRDAPAIVRNINGCGPTAVSLFFVLSGVVLAYGATDDEGRCAKPRRRFWLDRFARIWPLFAVAAILAMPLDLGRLRHEWGTTGAAALVYMVVHTVLALFLFQAWIPHLAVTANGPGWSLSVEAFFYVLFPSIVHRLRVHSTAQLVRRVALFWTLSMAPVLAVWLLERQHPSLRTNHLGFLGVNITQGFVLERLVLNNPVFRLSEFCIGICVGHWLVMRARRTTEPAPQRGDRLRPLEMLTVGSLVVFLVAVAFAGALHDPRELLIQSGYLAPVLAMLLVGIACGARPFARVLSSKPLVVLGTASYALYIIQEPFDYYWTKIVGLDLARPMWFVVFLALLLTASVVAEQLIEKPARTWLIARFGPLVSARRQPSSGRTAR